MALEEEKAGLTYVGCAMIVFIFIAVLIVCIAIWVAFGPVFGLLAIGGFFVLLALFSLLVIVVNKKQAKNKNDEQGKQSGE